MFNNGKTLFIIAGDLVFGSGFNTSGQLGIGNVITQTTTTLIPITGVKKIYSLEQHTLFLMNDGTVKGCGVNNNSRLGDIGSPGSTITDLAITGVRDIACGPAWTFFIMNDGTVKGCGLNTSGQLGIGNTTTQTSIINIPITGVKDIACGLQYTIFLMNDGTAKGCGNNTNGQLGLGATSQEHSIIDIPISDVRSISCGAHHTVFVLNDNNVKVCGYNNYYQLGTGNTAQQTAIVTLTGTTVKDKVKKVICGLSNTIFILTDDTVRVIGYNPNGQLGTGSTSTVTSILTNQLNIEPVADVICGENTTYFILSNGLIKAAGANNIGQFGNADISSSASIVSLNRHNVGLFKNNKSKYANTINSKFSKTNVLGTENSIFNTTGLVGDNNFVKLSKTSITDNGKNIHYSVVN